MYERIGQNTLAKYRYRRARSPSEARQTKPMPGAASRSWSLKAPTTAHYPTDTKGAPMHIGRSARPQRPARYVIRREAATRAELLAGGWTDSDLHEFPWPIVVHAYAVDPAGSERLIEHHVRHSPSGFEFGYEGSGPAELARCLLLDFFDLHERADARDQSPLPVSYQQFKRQLIASIPRSTREHTIEIETLDTWVREQIVNQHHPDCGRG
jgi:hypothetical protein